MKLNPRNWKNYIKFGGGGSKGTWVEIQPAGDSDQYWTGDIKNDKIIVQPNSTSGKGYYSDNLETFTLTADSIGINPKISDTNLYTFRYYLHYSTNGINWNNVFPPASYGGYDVSKNGEIIYIGGAAGSYKVYKSIDSGANWVEVSPIAGDYSWSSISTSDDGSIVYAARDNGRMYKSVNGGTNWSEVRPNGDINAAWIISTDGTGNKVLVNNINNYTAFYSSDGGANWNQISVSNIQKVAISDNGSKMLISDSSFNVYSSSDGIEWNEEDVSPSNIWSLALNEDGTKALVMASRLYLYK